MQQEVLFGSAGTAEKMFRTPLVIRPLHTTLSSHIDHNGALWLPYSVTTTEGKHWRDDDRHPYSGLVPADNYDFKVDRQPDTPIFQSVVKAARAAIDPIVAEYAWVLTLKRTGDRDYFTFWIAPEQGHPNAPYFKFCDGSHWHWTYLFPPKSQHYDTMVAARARD